MNSPAAKPRTLEITLAALILLGLCAAAFIALNIQRTRRGQNHDLLTAASNGRSLAFALLEFQTEHGYYPNQDTAKTIQAATGSLLDLTGPSSNAAFRQLIASDILQTETVCHAPITGTHRPNNIISPAQALKKGECGFSYISGLSGTDAPTTPLLLTPLIPGTTRFDPKPFAGKAVVILIDCSYHTYDIEPDGRILDKGIDLLSPKHPIWRGKALDIRYPDL